MKTNLDCIPCFLKQALDAARLAGADEKTQKEILDEVAGKVREFSLDASPPAMGQGVYGTVARLTGNPDPFKELKKKSNELALGLYPSLKKLVASSKDRLKTAVELAAIGNVIDYGAKGTLDIKGEIDKVLAGEFASSDGNPHFAYDRFRRAMAKAEKVLYLADNTGEIVFDRVLIEELDREVTLVVRGAPIINDALLEDAVSCGLNKCARVIDNGSDLPGTIPERCSRAFQRHFREAELIISKGQGNYESLSGVKGNIFFLFRAKCQMVAREVGCQEGDMILLANE